MTTADESTKFPQAKRRSLIRRSGATKNQVEQRLWTELGRGQVWILWERGVAADARRGACGRAQPKRQGWRGVAAPAQTHDLVRTSRPARLSDSERWEPHAHGPPYRQGDMPEAAAGDVPQVLLLRLAELTCVRARPAGGGCARARARAHKKRGSRHPAPLEGVPGP